MKSKILLSCIVLLTVFICPSLMAQDEYYRPDSLKKEQPEEKPVPPVEYKKVEEKKKLADFKDRPFLERVRLGGSFGLSLGTVTNINLSPMAGYELTEKLVGGVGATLMYFRYKYYDINTVYYGGRGIFNVQCGARSQYYSRIRSAECRGIVSEKEVAWFTIGRSVIFPALGGRFIKAVHFTALYNLSYNSQIDQYSGQNLSPYGSPFVFRVTFL
jgi:hypothetical protein